MDSRDSVCLLFLRKRISMIVDALEAPGHIKIWGIPDGFVASLTTTEFVVNQTNGLTAFTEFYNDGRKSHNTATIHKHYVTMDNRNYYLPDAPDEDVVAYRLKGYRPMLCANAARVKSIVKDTQYIIGLLNE